MSERHESLVERKIREAQEQGVFDNLPGKGKPLRGLHAVDDENWWLRGFVERHGLQSDALLPTPLRLRKEVERLPETVRDLSSEQAVRAVVRELNERIAAFRRTPTGPSVVVGFAVADDVVARWREQRVTCPSSRPSPRAPLAVESDATTPDGRQRRLRRWWYVHRR